MESTVPEPDLVAADVTVLTRPPKSLWRETLERLLRKPSAIVGLVLLGALVLIAIFAPLIATHDPLAVLLDVPEEGADKRMAPCIHLIGCPKAGEELFRVSAPIQIAAPSKTNSLMLGAMGTHITIWNASDAKEVASFELDAPVSAVSWTPNDQKLLIASGNQLVIWDISRRVVSQTIEQEGISNFVSWNADGSRFLSGDDNTVRIWDALAYREIGVIELDGPRIAAGWNSNGTIVMTASGSVVKLWNAFTATEIATMEHPEAITSAAMNSASTQLLTSSANTLRIWNMSSYQEERVIEYEGPLDNAAWGENLSRGIRWVMATSGNIGVVWKATNGELIHQFDHGAPVNEISSSHLATRIFTRSTDTIELWDTENGEKVFAIDLNTPIESASWQESGGSILVVTESDLRLIKTSNYQYLMGVDGNVRDQFSRVIHGTRVSLMVGLLTVSLAVIVGTIAGAVAGYLGGWVDNVIMRIMDVMLAFPPLILAIAVVTVLGPGLINALLAISIVFIPAYARVTRSGVLAVKEEDFVTADRVLGVRPVRILFRRILPNALSPLIVQATLGIGTAILDAAALSFLGLGAQPPTPEWGAMLGSERNQIFTAPHLVFYPGIMIMITVLAFNLLGDGLRDALDPRLDR